MTHVTVPPILSSAALNFCMSASILDAASVFGVRTGANEFTVGRSIVSMRLRNSGFVAGVG